MVGSCCARRGWWWPQIHGARYPEMVFVWYSGRMILTGMWVGWIVTLGPQRLAISFGRCSHNLGRPVMVLPVGSCTSTRRKLSPTVGGRGSRFASEFGNIFVGKKTCHEVPSCTFWRVFLLGFWLSLPPTAQPVPFTRPCIRGGLQVTLESIS